MLAAPERHKLVCGGVPHFSTQYETGNIRLTTYENKVGYGVKKVGAGMGTALKARRLVARGCGAAVWRFGFSSDRIFGS